MRLIKHFIFTVIALALFALPAKASEYQDMDICLGRQIVARILCKPVIEINFVTKVRENIYLFSCFYAKKEAHFFVGVYKDMIRVQGKEFKTITRTIPYHFDETAKCGVVDYSVPDCETNERIVCCSEKTAEEELDDKFWDRPITDLLDEDLRNALEEDQQQEEQPTPEGEQQQDGEAPTPAEQ